MKTMNKIIMRATLLIMYAVFSIPSFSQSSQYELHDDFDNEVQYSALKNWDFIGFWDGAKMSKVHINLMDNSLYIPWGDGLMEHLDFFPNSTRYSKEGNSMIFKNSAHTLTVVFMNDPQTKEKYYTVSFNTKARRLEDLLSSKPVEMMEVKAEGVVFFNKKGSVIGYEDQIGSHPVLFDALEMFGKKCKGK